MKLPPDVKRSEAAKALKRHGLPVIRQTGSHLIMRTNACVVVVPQRWPLKPDTVNSVIEQAD